MAELFNVKVPAISKHIKNIIESEELDSKATISKMETVQKEGNREIKTTCFINQMESQRSTIML